MLSVKPQLSEQERLLVDQHIEMYGVTRQVSVSDLIDVRLIKIEKIKKHNRKGFNAFVIVRENKGAQDVKRLQLKNHKDLATLVVSRMYRVSYSALVSPSMDEPRLCVESMNLIDPELSSTKRVFSKVSATSKAEKGKRGRKPDYSRPSCDSSYKKPSYKPSQK